jgi:glycosyltransferase involved in cell wall biosynthesis
MLLTVFTPTYNRAYLLPQLFDSLMKQTNQHFVWLIIDDGSTDNTRELIDSWKEKASFKIQYIYQNNQGMHGGHNTAYAHCFTPFNVCIDSDDFMPDNAVELIINQINNLEPEFAGIVGLDADKNTLKVIGTCIPKSLQKVKLGELYSKYGVKGDKKVVLRTEIARHYPPYPIFEGEKFVPLDYLYLMINQDYYFKPVNEVYCIVEYQTDGSTKNILKQYKRHPNGFAFSRVSRINYASTLKEKFRNAIHLVSSAIFAKRMSWLFESKYTMIVIIAIPLGLLLNVYIRFKIMGQK